MHKLHILPSVFCDMDDQEKAFIIASIKIRIEAEEKEAKKIKSKSKGR